MTNATISAVNARSTAFERNFAAGDIDRLVDGFFVPDEHQPMLSPPGGRPPIIGRAGLKEQFAFLRGLYTAIAIETLSIEAGTDLASQIGRVRLTTVDGEVEVGRYTVLWRLCEDGWRAKLDFFAADAWPD